MGGNNVMLFLYAELPYLTCNCENTVGSGLSGLTKGVVYLPHHENSI